MSDKRIDIRDLIGGAFFLLLTICFILLMVFNSTISDWAWARHHNILSWYIRPLPLLPFIYFAYKRNLTGMSFSIFAIFTSMAWFPAPETVSPQVEEFLAMEIDYLRSNWSTGKILLSMSVPLMFILLGYAFWKRSFVYGVVVLIVTAVAKLSWGVVEAGQSGWSMLAPALVGLIISLTLIYFAHWRQSRPEKVQAG